MNLNKVIITICISFLPIMATAQKAYEAISFRGKINGITIRLTYADGYLGASEIKATNTKITTAYLPEFGVPDEHHQLNFYHYSARQPLKKFDDHIVLDKIDEDKTAPKTISGTYYINGKQFKFILSR